MKNLAGEWESDLLLATSLNELSTAPTGTGSEFTNIFLAGQGSDCKAPYVVSREEAMPAGYKGEVGKIKASAIDQSSTSLERFWNKTLEVSNSVSKKKKRKKEEEEERGRRRRRKRRRRRRRFEAIEIITALNTSGKSLLIR